METIDEMIRSLQPWFHNLHLPNGKQTAPDHYLGDFPHFKWLEICPYIQENLEGWNVLDIGCNAGFYSFELARRGAQVLAIDIDDHYLNQARWAALQYGLQDRISFQKMQVYDLARSAEKFDLIWFMGVLYHLRHPLLSLDIIARRTGKLLVFQTMSVPTGQEYAFRDNFCLSERNEVLQQDSWPKMAFIEGSIAGDPTNWWVPNSNCIEALLRASGFKVLSRPGDEIYICEVDYVPLDPDDIREQEYKAATGQEWRFTKI